MYEPNIIVGPAQVYAETDWHGADGAMLTDDDQVVPMAHIGVSVGTAMEDIAEGEEGWIDLGSKSDPDEPAAA